MIETLIEKLFKFAPLRYKEGIITFQSGDGLYYYLVLLLLLAAGVAIIYFITNIYASSRSRAFSLSLRIMALLLLCLPLLEPVLMTPDIVPNENFLVVLADNSASMSIEDGKFGGTRYQDINRLLNDKDSGIIGDLSENFKVRFYTFSDETERVDSLGSRPVAGIETNITDALERVLSDFKGLPLTGIVLLSDGGDNSLEDPRTIAEELADLDIPLHIVGLGSEEFEQDRELLEVLTNKGLEEGTGAEISIKARSWIEETGPVAFNIYKGDELVFSKDYYLGGGGKIDHFTLYYEPEEKGVTEYILKVEDIPGEINAENNALNVLLDTYKDTIRVLYFEGHLRNDFKFIKRALEDDQVVEFVSVSRTGTDKYYRQGIRHEKELEKGFPQTEAELFDFKAVVFGDIEASYFTFEQLAMVENFVRERGGGFLMLGGRNSFAEGDFYNTPVADLLPVEIDPSRKQIIEARFHNPNRSSEDQGFRFSPTREGLSSPILKLAPELRENRIIWDEMPPMTSINYFGGVKPGATVLAEKSEDSYGSEEPLLVVQKYGRGRTAALGTSSTWRWQMMLPSEDSRHERFWRQMIRWLITSAPDNVNIVLTDNVFAPGDEVPIRVTAFDEDYNSLEFLDVKGTITDPAGEEHEIKFYPDLTMEGEYTTVYVPLSPGIHSISVEAENNGKLIGTQKQGVLARPSKKEYYNATLKRKYLENLAYDSNGYYYSADGISSLVSNVKNRKSSTSIYRNEYLWDMPFIFGLVFLLLVTEWIYRRRKGLP
ncbi:hypothetical protein ACFL6L_00935 [candidate division KSB1 bacterium]